VGLCRLTGAFGCVLQAGARGPAERVDEVEADVSEPEGMTGLQDGDVGADQRLAERVQDADVSIQDAVGDIGHVQEPTEQTGRSGDTFVTCTHRGSVN
jgi:hypothetical protein